MEITLKFTDKELKCSLGLMFLGEFLDVVDMSITDVGEKMQKNPFKILPKMIHTSAKVAAELDDEEFTLSLKELVGMIEKDGGVSSPQITLFVTAWTKSMLEGVPEEKPAEEGGEKAKK